MKLTSKKIFNYREIFFLVYIAKWELLLSYNKNKKKVTHFSKVEFFEQAFFGIFRAT